MARCPSSWFGWACAIPRRPRSVPLPGGVEAGSVAELLADDSLDAVVELTGGVEEPLEWSRATLRAGRAYVTGNKALLATHGGELAELARQNRAALLGSASVGGGTPMIETVQHLATAGGIERIRGLLNATTTFILAAMGEGRSYDAALAEAQDAGYAEPDPTFDVTGRDAAQKIAILASVAWGRWLPEQAVATRGIVGIRVEPDETQRLVAEADEQGARVGPMALGADDPLAGVSGIECLLEVQLREGAVFRLAGPGCRRAGERARHLRRPGTPAGRRAADPLRPTGWPRERLAGRRGGGRSRRGGRRLPVHPGRCRPARRRAARLRLRGGDRWLRRWNGAHAAARRGRGSGTGCPVPGHRWRHLARDRRRTWPRRAADRGQLERLPPGPAGAAGRAGGERPRHRPARRQPRRQPELHHRRGGDRAGSHPRPGRAGAVDLASYQAVSGAGRAGLDAYETERAAGGTAQAEGSPFHGPDRRQRGAADRRPRRRRLERRGAQDHGRAAQDPGAARP